ncbi:MAG: hypothetical protein K6U03_04525, partial [Firmicutes bacterium]|nr:hypothetical protein [Bacillota bacterium]
RELYHLIFATKHWRGLDVMKQAMWVTDPTGNFQFSDYTYSPNQLHLFPSVPDFGDLAKLIWQNFRGQTVSPEKIEKWVVVGTPQYASTHVRQALKLLEDQGRLKKYIKPEKMGVEMQPYQRKGKFPENKIIIEFVED